MRIMKAVVSKKYILARSLIFVGILSIVGIFTSLAGFFGLVLLGLLVSGYQFFINSRCRFYIIDPDGVVTKKLFTADTVVKTPYRNITEVQEFAGLLEAFCGCGTIEITTNSGKKISWDHIQGEESIANEIQKRISNL